MRIAPLLVTAVTTVMALAVQVRPAAACSPPRCWPGYLTPSNGAVVPANLPAFAWMPVRGYDNAPADPSKVTLTAGSGATIALTATVQPDGSYVLVPATALVAGETYSILDSSTCGDLTTGVQAGPSATFTTVAAAALPTLLGTLSAQDEPVSSLQVSTSSGSCTAEVQADQAPIDLLLAAEAAPWRDALHFTTLVDGRPWSASPDLNFTAAPSESWIGRGVDRVYTVCSSQDTGVASGLAAGGHVVEMQATLPGTTTVVTSATTQVTLACADLNDMCVYDRATCEDPSGDVNDGGGCSTSGGLAVLPGLALLALLVPFRRRATA